MKPIIADSRYVAACGLYCGACRKYLNDKCPGCRQNEKATWCRIRSCCLEKGFKTCAECSQVVTDCKLYSNWVSRVFAFVFNSDRPACIRFIKDQGEQAFAEEMTKRQCQTIKRR